MKKTRKRSETPNYGALRPESLPEGYVIDDRYEIIRKLGQGGFGAVYLAHDKEMDIDKALKILPESFSHDEEAMEDLRSEAKTMVSLNHHNIVRVYDLHARGKIKYIDMEYIDGKTLTGLKLEYPNKQMPEEKVCELAMLISEGISYAHDRGIIHKDIKPQNIMVDANSQIKIMDFGIAETVRTSMSRIDNTSSSGTLVYMSPEQLMGNDVGKESDIYSFGATLYELLSGHPPFYKGDTSYQIVNKEPADIDGVSVEMNSILQKCLLKDYADRYSDFEEVRAELVNITPVPQISLIEKDILEEKRIEDIDEPEVNVNITIPTPDKKTYKFWTPVNAIILFIALWFLVGLILVVGNYRQNSTNSLGITQQSTSIQKISSSDIQAIMDEVSALGTPSIEADEVAVIETNFGRMVIEFDLNNAPIHAANFKKLANAGYYDGVTFHRIIPGFMIQGGDINSRDNDPTNDGMGGPGYTVGAEIHNVHKRGTIAAARTGNNVNPERMSSGSQFYICHVDIPHLDGEYTVYGKVIEGIEVIDKIAEVNTGPGDRPLEDVVMVRVYMTTKSELGFKSTGANSANVSPKLPDNDVSVSVEPMILRIISMDSERVRVVVIPDDGNPDDITFERLGEERTWSAYNQFSLRISKTRSVAIYLDNQLLPYLGPENTWVSRAIIQKDGFVKEQTILRARN